MGNSLAVELDAVRKRPGMYIGSTGPRGIEQVVYELVANAIDLFLRGEASRVWVSIQEQKITVTDDGPGLPFDEPAPDNQGNWVEYHLTHLHRTPSAQGHAPHVHLIFNGVGLAVVNALSQTLEIQSYSQDRGWTQRFAKGVACGPAEGMDPASARGTTISLVLDRDIFGETQPRMGLVRKKLFEAAHLFPGLHIQLEEEAFFTPRGLADLAYSFLEAYDWEIWEPFYLNTQYRDVIIQAAGIGERRKHQKTIFHSWANGERTYQHGRHLDGFKDAMKQIGWSPAVALIHVIMKNPEYAGPMKQQPINPQVRADVKDCLSMPLQAFLSQRLGRIHD